MPAKQGLSGFAQPKIRDFPQVFPQVWKTLGRDQRLHGIAVAGIGFEKDADCNTFRAD